MRRFLLVVSLLAPAMAAAQIPTTISFQGLLTDTTGAPLDSLIDLKFTLYDSTGASVWMETHIDAEVKDGVYNIRLGSLSSLSQVPFDQPYEIGITVGQDPEMVPRTPFDAAPYALSSSCPECPEPTCADLSLETCPSGCTDLQTDESNCGECSTQCTDGQLCESGSCTLSCQPGLTNCSGVCTDTQTDRLNCGGCGNPCDPGHICSSGTCELSCQTGLVNCSGTCVDTDTDESNCGGCGNPCGSGEVCTGGVCSPA